MAMRRRGSSSLRRTGAKRNAPQGYNGGSRLDDAFVVPSLAIPAGTSGTVVGAEWDKHHKQNQGSQ